MKKLIFLLTAVIVTALSSNVFGQGTYIAPEIGSVHDYSVTDNGNSYSWTVTSDVAGCNQCCGLCLQHLSVEIHQQLYKLPGLIPTIGNTYYVHVTETDGNGCSKQKSSRCCTC